MAAPTETYVDPSIAGDSGAGTVGDPYGDIQHALDTVTQDAVDGDRMNIKAGTDEVLAAALDLTTYGTPSEAAPLIFRGYTSSAADGGIGGIDGDGSYAMISNIAIDHVHFCDMHLHNSGAAIVIRMDNQCSLTRCEIDNTTGDGIRLDNGARVFDCHIHNVGSSGIIALTTASIMFNTIENGTNDVTTAIFINGADGFIGFNIIDIDGSSNGISVGGSYFTVMNNSVYSNGGTGTGIDVSATRVKTNILNNVVEGFIGVGGDGFVIAADVLYYGNNAAYNNTTNYSFTGSAMVITGTNEVLSASAFIDAANQDFTIDTTVKATAWPSGDYPSLSERTYFDKGALQRKEFPRIHPGYSGGLQ